MVDARWFVPDWPAPTRVRALFTTRGSSPADGASPAPYQYFNLGDHVGDAADAVAANRALLAQALGAARPVFLHQVHGTGVCALSPDLADGTTADAAFSTRSDVACTVMVADCLPVLLTTASGSAVAAAHAGWRGLASGVLQATLEQFRPAGQAGRAQPAIDNEANQGADPIIAWLGPCIGPRAFEVGAEVREAFLAQDAGADPAFAPHTPGKFLADLPALARRVLLTNGVTAVYGNDGSDAWCTVARPDRYFSFRRDQSALGGTGRMAACIWIDEVGAPSA
ncbi:peptidoglycan editing factor PgeF [Ottowia sp. GY511]|uniref:Purine nucleoside phosphorylase n=1 Tax=Ottowia flava TaxID=2675430 RepID=A0ABW4KSJ3_9BURK|nr:peptidoglycan editing factor PgeF [Ottowia sp. GY511]TXK33414.1 peptidoglycan editing factor PgeF [Ottowia sp. GY511]